MRILTVLLALMAGATTRLKKHSTQISPAMNSCCMYFGAQSTQQAMAASFVIMATASSWAFFTLDNAQATAVRTSNAALWDDEAPFANNH